MRLECLVACVGIMRIAYKIFVGKPEVEKPKNRDLVVDRRFILKRILK
jgi:hypothetical protein